MGREVRRVPPDWKHPFDKKGNLQPMYDRSYQEEAEEWLQNCIAWSKGEHEDQKENPEYIQKYPFYWEYAGNPPDPKYHRPHWTEEERTHYQMYEDTTEGTPISPVFDTPERLARWLADNGASAMGDNTATYEQWLRVCHGGWAPSMVVSNGRIYSGVEFEFEKDKVQESEEFEEFEE